MPNQDESHLSVVSPSGPPKKIGTLIVSGGRVIDVYDDRIVFKSPSRRVELMLPLTFRERHALAALVRPPVSAQTPSLESAFGSGKLTTQEWLREVADVTAEAEESGVVVTDDVVNGIREEDIQPSVFTTVATYIDWLEQSVIERDELIKTLERQLEAR